VHEQLLFGVNANETVFTVFAEISPTNPIPPSHYTPVLGALFGADSAAAIATLYPCTSDGAAAVEACFCNAVLPRAPHDWGLLSRAGDCRYTLAGAISDAWQLCPSFFLANSTAAQVGIVLPRRCGRVVRP
jgi:hypothetical protein